VRAMRSRTGGRWRVARAVGTALAAVLLAVPVILVAGASPAGAFELTTAYPAVRVGPGEQAEMDLAVTSPTIERVALAVTEVPPGWQARLTGGGFQIGAVFTDPDDPPEVTLKVNVPDDAAEGVHRIVVRAQSGAQVVDLPVEFDVAADAPGAFTLTSEFAQLRGSSTDTFRFDLDLESDSPREATFDLAATGPEGWTITARPSGQSQATSVTVEPGGSATIQVEANPPDDVPAGTYPITVRASGAGADLGAELLVDVVGSYSLELTTADERLGAEGNAGDTTSVGLVLRNTGSAPLEDVSFSATPPSGWDVTFSPDRLDTVPPGEAVPVTARIRPDGDAVAGDYAVTLRVSGSGQSDNVELRFAVETSRWWGFIGLGIIAIAVVGLLFVFRRFGRR